MFFKGYSTGLKSLFLAGILMMPLPSYAFDPTASAAPQSAPEMPAAEAARQGTKAYRAGNMQEAITRWTKAAEGGHATAQWRLARMFADGKGVPRNDQAAFKWFKQIVDDHADEEPGTMQGQIAGRAFVEVGSYYLAGIPNSDVKQDNTLAWRMFYHAASVFGDVDAQYRLGVLYLEGQGVEKNSRLAMNWLKNAADKCNFRAQAKLGELLLSGEDNMPRRGVEGLMWLSVARNQAQLPEDQWIVTAFEDAYTMASDEERMQAATHVRRWQCPQTASR